MNPNRLAGECEDQVVGGSVLNNVNGFAYSAKGELKQSSAFFLKASAEYLKLRETEMWANTHAYCAMTLFENGLGGKAAAHLRRGLGAAVEMNNSAALSLLASVSVDQLAFGSDGDAAAFSEIYESEIVGLLEPEGQFNLTSWSLMQWRIGKIDGDEAMKGMIKQQGAASWTPSHLYMGDRLGSTFGFLEVFDYAEATGNTSIGGVSVKEVLGYVIVNTKFLEGLGKSYAYVLPWSLLFRGCVLRRENKAGVALKVILEGIEAASKSSSRACLSYLWLEKGLCQEKGKGLGAAVHVEGGGGGGGCVKSYNTSVDLAVDSGMHAIAAKGRRQLRGFGIERADDSQGGLSRSESTLMSGTGSLSTSNRSLIVGSEWSAGIEGGGKKGKKGRRKAARSGSVERSGASGVSSVNQGAGVSAFSQQLGESGLLSESRGGAVKRKNSSLNLLLSKEGAKKMAGRGRGRPVGSG